jgi:hypothetical protein
MKASELVIGKCQVTDILSTNVLGVKSNTLMVKGNTEKEKTFMIDILDFKPIPLTEKWLLKFGYEKFDKCFSYKGHDIVLRKDEADFYFGEYGDWSRIIYYVHQLQNLYFSLCGEEL